MTRLEPCCRRWVLQWVVVVLGGVEVVVVVIGRVMVVVVVSNVSKVKKKTYLAETRRVSSPLPLASSLLSRRPLSLPCPLLPVRVVAVSGRYRVLWR